MSNQTKTTSNWPLMLTPFKDDKSIDWPGVYRLTDWYIESGASGLFAVCVSSEMYELQDDECIVLARHIVIHLQSLRLNHSDESTWVSLSGVSGIF